MQKLAVILGSAMLVSTGVQAANLLVNGSFENTQNTWVNNNGFGDTGVMDLFPGSTAIPGWTVADGGSGHDIAWLVNGNNYGLTASDGRYFLDLTGYDNSPLYSGVEQTVGTVAGKTYQISFDVGEDEGQAGLSGPIGVSVSAKADGGAGATDLAETAINDTAGTGNIWDTFSYDFTASSTSTQIEFLGSEGQDYIGLDNARLTIVSASVPDVNSTLELTIISLGFLGWSGRRMRIPVRI